MVEIADLDLVLNMVDHERIEVRKRAVDILAVMTSPTANEASSEVHAVTTALSTLPSLRKLLGCFTDTNKLLYGSLLTTLVNLSRNIEVVRTLIELQGIVRVMRFFFGQLTSAVDAEKAPLSTSLMDLILMLLSNLTSLGGAAAAAAFLQVDAESDLRGYYLERLLEHFPDATLTTCRWLLNVLTNISCEDLAKERILGSTMLIERFGALLATCDQNELHSYYVLCILRNCAIGADEKHHEAIAQSNLLSVVLAMLSDDRARGCHEVLGVAVELVYILCTTKTGVEAMETCNGKLALRTMLNKPEHTIHHEDVATSKAYVTRLMDVLDDVQDVVVQTHEDAPTPLASSNHMVAPERPENAFEKVE